MVIKIILNNFLNKNNIIYVYGYFVFELIFWRMLIKSGDDKNKITKQYFAINFKDLVLMRYILNDYKHFLEK